MNRQQLAYVRVVALFMAGVVALLTLGNLFTIVTKGISVYLPTEKDIHWSIDPLQKEILFRTTFTVKNEGFYDINDIDISAKLVKQDRTPLYSFQKQDLVVVHGTNTTFDLLIPFDLDKISFFNWFSLIYKNTTLKLLLNINALYMFGLIQFTADETIDIPWSSPPLNLSDNATVKAGIHGLCTLFKLTENTSISSISDLISLISLPQISYNSSNGFSFSLSISSYSETVKNITCQIVVPLLVVDGGFEFTASFLVGFEGNEPVFVVQGVGIEYVNQT